MPGAKLRIKRRMSPWAAILPLLRFVTTSALIVVMVIAGWRYITRTPGAGALEFTAHAVSVETSTVGVKDVAAADFDGDGDQDVIGVGNDGIKIYENTGSFTFTLHVVDDDRSENVAIADLDADGDLDFVVSMVASSPSARWYKNNSGFEFSATNLATSGSNAVVAAGDINGDQKADIITASNNGGSIVLERWMNNGSGTFASTTLSSGSGVTWLAVGNLGADSYKDIITSGTGGLQRWDTTNGTTWTRADIDDDNANRDDIELGDPGDGRTWIVTADHVVDEIVVYRSGTGDDRLRFGRIVLATDVDGKQVATGDLDGDGDLDVLATGQDNNTVYWFENIGSDTFTKHTLATNLQSVYGVDVADMDGDGDLDVLADDHMRGTIWAYERKIVAPVATKPSSISQSTSGNGLITFKTTLSDGDRDASRIRIQYSLDGDHWYKPWLTKVSASAGAVDLKNSNGYQIGTSNPIDTDDHDSVTLTLTWDTKSVENTGGPIKGDVGSVQLRVLPRDNRTLGGAATSSAFRVDNAAPTGLSGLTLGSISGDSAALSWPTLADSSDFFFELYYGTDHTAVLEGESDVWDEDDDEAMSDFEATGTTVTGLTGNQTYSFKLFATDEFGNTVAAPSVRGTTSAGESETGDTPIPSPSPDTSPEASPSPNSSPDPSPTPQASPSPTATPSPGVTPTPTPTPSPPSTLTDNQAPEADAGMDQVVNPSALVVLDGTASADPDRDSLVYSWRQLAGPVVELISERTATPSFSVGEAGESYIFLLTVRDPRGASTTDTVTVATRELPAASTAPVEIVDEGPAAPTLEADVRPAIVRILDPINLILLALSIISAGLSLAERAVQAIKSRQLPLTSGSQETARGRVLHYKTGEAIAGAQVLIYGGDSKLIRTERTNAKGEFASFFPRGQYTLGVQAEGFTFAPAAIGMARPDEGILYTGGKITVQRDSQPLAIVVPMKPVGHEVSSSRTRFLHLWQFIQRMGRALSWPIFLAGALINTFLVFRAPNAMHLIIEIVYVVLVIIKVVLEVRVRPAYGLVRDAITHVPLDLAVVRLFEAGTNRLIMTRVTNAQGKFFALPPAGTYTVTVTKPGYGVFSKPNVEIAGEHDSTLQMTADLMPVAPVGGLAAARAATL